MAFALTNEVTGASFPLTSSQGEPMGALENSDCWLPPIVAQNEGGTSNSLVVWLCEGTMLELRAKAEFTAPFPLLKPLMRRPCALTSVDMSVHPIGHEDCHTYANKPIPVGTSADWASKIW